MNAADAMLDLMYAAGVRRCYGIVGDALNPTTDALWRHGGIEFVHVQHEEYGGFAAVADAYVTDAPVAIRATAGPGVTHLVDAPDYRFASPSRVSRSPGSAISSSSQA